MGRVTFAFLQSSGMIARSSDFWNRCVNMPAMVLAVSFNKRGLKSSGPLALLIFSLVSCASTPLVLTLILDIDLLCSRGLLLVSGSMGLNTDLNWRFRASAFSVGWVSSLEPLRRVFIPTVSALWCLI